MKTILLVEDNVDDRMYIAEMIQDASTSTDVHAVATGEEAMDFFQHHKPHCSIVDYRLETEDGLTISGGDEIVYHPSIQSL